jgi:hypothetical protein
MKKYTFKNAYCDKCNNIDEYPYCRDLRREHHAELRAEGGFWEAVCLSRELHDPHNCPLALYYRRQTGLIDDWPRTTPLYYKDGTRVT